MKAIDVARRIACRASREFLQDRGERDRHLILCRHIFEVYTWLGKLRRC